MKVLHASKVRSDFSSFVDRIVCEKHLLMTEVKV